jgi:hypothetical protein
MHVRPMVALVASLLAAALASAQQPDPARREAPPAGPRPTAGPYVHAVASATSADGITWTRDAGTRLEHASVPAAIVDGNRVLIYYVDADRGPELPESVGCASSTDGTHFEKQSFTIEGMTARKAVDPSIVRDPAGRFRLYYLASTGEGDPGNAPGDHEIRVAISDDGVRFRDTGAAFRAPGLVDPDVFIYRGTWFMYVFAPGRTIIATSTDGLSFTYVRDLEPANYGTVAPIQLDDGRLRLYAFEQRVPRGNAVVSFSSTDGLSWTREPGVRLQAAAEEQITDPFVVRWRGVYRMFFKTDTSRGRGPAPGAMRGPGQPGPPNRNGPGPWNNDVLVFRVTPDRRSEQVATFERAGVPTVARLYDGRLVAAHQHFPADSDADFDKVAVRFSADEGRTWTPPRTIRVAGLPDGMRFPFDPTLVPLPDGRVRLYFTSVRTRPRVPDSPAIYSAVSTDAIDFVVEPGVRFGVEGRPVIDCAVVLHEGVFHLFAPDNGTGPLPNGPTPAGGAGPAPLRPANEPPPAGAYHATSRDGLTFARQTDIGGDGRRRWLGNAMSEKDAIVFVGTGGQGGVWVAKSRDGVSWEPPQLMPIGPGADPGAVPLKDGALLIIVTGPPRR